MGFFDGGAKSLSFGKMGDNTWLNRWRGGVITNVGEEKPQTDWRTGKVIFQKDGVTPKTQVIITLLCDGNGPLGLAAGMSQGLTNERTDPSDDGRRGLYVKGNLRYDIGNKLRELGVRDPEVGSELYIKMTGTRSTDNGEGRTYEVLYFPPVGPKAGGFFGGDTPAAEAARNAAPAYTAPAPQYAPQQAQAQAPAPAFNQAPPGADPFGGAPAPQQATQPPAQGSPFGGAAPTAPPQASNNPFA
jgi:hypothetical protein